MAMDTNSSVAMVSKGGENINPDIDPKKQIVKEEVSELTKPLEVSSSENPQTSAIAKVIVSKEELDNIDLSRLKDLWAQQELYVDQVESRLQESESSLSDLKARGSQLLDPAKRDQVLVMKLASKEQEIHELSNQISELKAAQAPGTSQLKSTLVDPAVNIILQKLKVGKLFVFGAECVK